MNTQVVTCHYANAVSDASIAVHLAEEGCRNVQALSLLTLQVQPGLFRTAQVLETILCGVYFFIQLLHGGKFVIA